MVCYVTKNCCLACQAAVFCFVFVRSCCAPLPAHYQFLGINQVVFTDYNYVAAIVKP
jgi:hypothetical protein